MLFSSAVPRFVVDVEEAGSTTSYLDDEGFVLLHGHRMGSAPARSVADLDDGRSLALLGEPGPGRAPAWLSSPATDRR